jgi:succinate dehydrogenase / fumarate reductase, cytochrome b subunit
MSATARSGRPAQAPPQRPLRGPLHGAAGWARGRHVGSVAFVANRVTGLLLIGYLYLHLGVLYLLTEGAGSWATVLHLFKNHYFLGLESLLILFILVHGLNGIRLAVVGTGVGVRHQKAWFTAAMAVSAALYVVVVLAMFGVI